MDLREIKNIKLMSDADVVYPDKDKEKKVKVCLSPTATFFLYDKDDNGNFIKSGGYAEKFMANGISYRGVFDRDVKKGYSKVRGVCRRVVDGKDNELLLNVRNDITNSETLLQIGNDGDSVYILQDNDGETREFSLCRDKRGNLFSGNSNEGTVIIDEGKEKHFFYTFLLENSDPNPDPTYYPPFGNSVMCEFNVPLIINQLFPGTGMYMLYFNEDVPYYYYTDKNEKFYYNPVTKENKLIDQGPRVKKVIDKVREKTFENLANYGLSKYDKKNKIYLPTQQERKR